MNLIAQSTISGTIKDSETGEPLIAATVFFVDIQRGAQTNLDGQYKLENIPYGTYMVRFSFIGYNEKILELTVNQENQTFDVMLESALLDLEEVVVTGYGAIDRQAFTGAVSTVSSEKLQAIPVTSADQLLQGNASGVVVTAVSGTPGANQAINIRGISSVNASSQPLFVIDGVPVVNGDNSSSTATSSLGILSSINPNDIESITVLKDAVSTAPYGARGSNGVIVITTKKGQVGKVDYSVQVQRGFNERAVRGPRTLNAFDYDAMVQELYGVSMADVRNWDGVTNTEWSDFTEDDNAIQEEYVISARGGNKTTQFYISGSVFRQEGQAIGTQLDRFNGTFDFSHQLDEKVTFQNSIIGSFTEQDGVLEGAAFFGNPLVGSYFMLPTDNPFNEDGEPNTNLNTSIFNPIYIQQNDIDRKRNIRVLNTSNLRINFSDKLSFVSRLSFDYLETDEKYYNNIFYGDADDQRGNITDTRNRNFNYVWQNTITYQWSPAEEHNFNFTGITESQKNERFVISASGEGIAGEGLINLANTATPTAAFSSTIDNSFQSFTGLVNYGYKSKLFLDASLRREGSSLFSEDNRWGNFWSLGLGYILTEESYMDRFDFIDFLKVRASYGVTGNAGVGANTFQDLFGTGSYGDVASITPAQIGNPNLTWELGKSLDLGMEFEMFQKISGSVTYFNKTSEDLLFSVPLSRTTGHASRNLNIGSLVNRGFEIELATEIVQTKDLTINIGANLSIIENEITQLPVDLNGEDIEITTATRYVAVEGFSINSWYMREWAGVDPENGDALWFTNDENGNRITTNSYNQADLYYQGANNLPTEFGGINASINFKGFYTSANLYYAFGNKVYDSWEGFLNSDGRNLGNFGQYARALDYWTEENRDAYNPRLFAPQSNAASSRFLYDGDFLRLRTLNIGYNIPNSFTESIGLQNASIFFVGQNLWTYVFDDRLQHDPEVQGGFLDLNIPALRSLTFGIKANF